MAISPGLVLLVQQNQGPHRKLGYSVQDTYLFQHVLESNRDIAILDLVFNTEPDLVNHVQTSITSSDSDHYMLTFNMHMKATDEHFSR